MNGTLVYFAIGVGLNIFSFAIPACRLTNRAWPQQTYCTPCARFRHPPLLLDNASLC